MSPVAIVVEWAQRKDHVLLTFQTPDALEPKVEFSEDQIVFSCKFGKEAESSTKLIKLFRAIDPAASNFYSTGRQVVAKLQKVNEDEDESFWPRLTKDKLKDQNIRVDFSKWKDESDEEFNDDNFNFDGDMSDMMAGMGGGAGGMPGGFGDDDDEMPDSDDDDDMPDLEAADSAANATASDKAPAAVADDVANGDGDSETPAAAEA